MTAVSTPIERPGVTIDMTLAQLLNVTEDSPAAIEWKRRMADLDAASMDVGTES